MINRYQSEANNVSNSEIKAIFVHNVSIMPKIRDICGASEVAQLLFMAHLAQLYFHMWSGNTHRAVAK